jgi:hypothetical protein
LNGFVKKKLPVLEDGQIFLGYSSFIPHLPEQLFECGQPMHLAPFFF